MARSERGPDQGSDLDELRRRIYREDATDEDRARYRALTQRMPQASPLRGPGADRAAHPEPANDHAVLRRGPRRVLLAGAFALVALAGIGLGILPRGAPEPPSPSPQAVTFDGPTRSEFVQNLAGGGAAGIAAYLVTHRPPAPLLTANRYFTIEREGTGPRTISLNSTPPETLAGRATVFLVLEVEGHAGWSASRIREQTDDPSPLQVIARRSGDQQSGVMTSATFRYPAGGRPVRLDIDAPAGVRWGAAVVFTD
jgi:hypothetical protein